VLRAHTEDLSATDDRTLVFTLKEPFAMLPQALATISAVIVPERLAQTPPTTAITEAIGCGPYRFVRDRWLSGARAEFVKFENYVPRKEGTSSGTAGPKVPVLDRVIWNVVPDPSTATAALQAGEVDCVERVSSDFLPVLKNDPNVELVVQTLPNFSIMRFNHLQPPFNNPAIRRAVLKAVDQREFMLAIQGEENKEYYKDNVGIFSPSSPMASDAGMEFMTAKRDLKALAKEIRDAGYKGERIVLLDPPDFPTIHAAALVGADLLQKLGFNVDIQAMNWGSVVQRRTIQGPSDEGGWNVYFTQINGLPNFDPASHLGLRANGKQAWFGWPDSPRIEELRKQWFAAPTVEAQKEICRELQLQAWEDVPYIPLGAMYNVSAYRKGWKGMAQQNPLFYNLQKA
jgi:peptide/nickel transport system substrate-binding protein